MATSGSRKRRWLAAGAAVAVLAAGGATTAAVVPGPSAERDLARYFFGPQMARAEFVMVVNGVARDFRIDQGRIRAVRPAAIELMERDGTLHVIPLAADAQVTLGGFPARTRALRPGMFALVLREGDQPATMVRARFR